VIEESPLSWQAIRRRLAGWVFRPIIPRLDELERRVRDTQALTARIYDASRDWRSTLDAIRAADDYDAAFAGDPLVTVRIATYNNAKILCERTLASLLRQTYPHWEAIVVGDACTDDTEDRIRDLGDPRIQFHNLPFRGPYPSDRRAMWQVAGTYPMNTALTLARGAWIAALDHDDEFSEDHVEVLLRQAQAAQAEVAYGKLRVVLADSGTELPDQIGAWPPRHTGFMFQSAIVHAGLRRFEYDINAHLCDEPGDWNMARRMWQLGVRFKFVDRIVGTYYLSPRPFQGAWAQLRAKGDTAL
jgi:Glycosyl transferase family 2